MICACVGGGVVADEMDDAGVLSVVCDEINNNNNIIIIIKLIL